MTNKQLRILCKTLLNCAYLIGYAPRLSASEFKSLFNTAYEVVDTELSNEPTQLH